MTLEELAEIARIERNFRTACRIRFLGSFELQAWAKLGNTVPECYVRAFTDLGLPFPPRAIHDNG